MDYFLMSPDENGSTITKKFESRCDLVEYLEKTCDDETSFLGDFTEKLQPHERIVMVATIKKPLPREVVKSVRVKSFEIY